MDFNMIGPAIVLGLWMYRQRDRLRNWRDGAARRHQQGRGKPRTVHRDVCDALVSVDLRLCSHDPHEKPHQARHTFPPLRHRDRPFRWTRNHDFCYLPRNVRSLGIQASAKQPAIIGSALPRWGSSNRSPSLPLCSRS